ncbi:HU family DNA-binding protein [Proteus mirabilis]|uniref:HU family DNA-binding protein n=1 Tax=Proteus mirabilis TaxID=584 RepID=UPI0034D5B08E
MANMQAVKKVVQDKLAKRGLEVSLPVVQSIISDVLTSVEDVVVAEGGSLRTEVGTFTLRTSKPRSGRNPSTGEALEIPARETIVLKSKHRKEVK